MTHIGKIGRLPQDIRNQLGQRIEDGLPGTEIVHWLNSLPDVQQVLKDHFGGRPITEQNLSEWKQTGHPEWLRRQEARLAALQLIEDSDEWESASDDRPMSDRLATVLSVEMVRLAMTLLEQETDPEKRWQRLCAVHQVLSQMRRDDHRALQMRIKQEQWEQELDAEDERAKQADKDRLIEAILTPIRIQPISQVFGGGEFGNKRAELIHRIKCDLPYEDLLKEITSPKPGRAKAPRPSAKAKPNPAPAQQPPVPASTPDSASSGRPTGAKAKAGALAQKNSELRTPQPALSSEALAKEELKESKLIQPNPTKSPTPQSSGLPKEELRPLTSDL
jgi:hypothetical protein